ncbi:gap-Pol polyprotein, partial [Clonorchis sinensis]
DTDENPVATTFWGWGYVDLPGGLRGYGNCWTGDRPDLQQSLDQALPGLDGASRQQLLTDQFVEGVQPALAAQLRLARATGQLSVEHLVHLARELAEAPLATFQSQENRQDSTVGDLEDKVDQLAAVKTESRKHARTSRCYKCSMPGHWRNQCPRTRPLVHNKILEYSSFPGELQVRKLPSCNVPSVQSVVEEYSELFTGDEDPFGFCSGNEHEIPLSSECFRCYGPRPLPLHLREESHSAVNFLPVYDTYSMDCMNLVDKKCMDITNLAGTLGTMLEEFLKEPYIRYHDIHHNIHIKSETSSASFTLVILGKVFASENVLFSNLQYTTFSGPRVQNNVRNWSQIVYPLDLRLTVLATVSCPETITVAHSGSIYAKCSVKMALTLACSFPLDIKIGSQNSDICVLVHRQESRKFSINSAFESATAVVFFGRMRRQQTDFRNGFRPGQPGCIRSGIHRNPASVFGSSIRGAVTRPKPDSLARRIGTNYLFIIESSLIRIPLAQLFINLLRSLIMTPLPSSSSKRLPDPESLSSIPPVCSKKRLTARRPSFQPPNLSGPVKLALQATSDCSVVLADISLPPRLGKTLLSPPPVGSQVLKYLHNLRTRLYMMEHEISPFRTIQSIGHLLNPDATCDPANLEEAPTIIDTMRLRVVNALHAVISNLACRTIVETCEHSSRITPKSNYNLQSLSNYLASSVVASNYDGIPTVPDDAEAAVGSIVPALLMRTLEHLVKGPLMMFLLATNAIDDRQYGFLLQRSVNDCQLHFFETVTAAYDAGHLLSRFIRISRKHFTRSLMHPC